VNTVWGLRMPARLWSTSQKQWGQCKHHTAPRENPE